MVTDDVMLGELLVIFTTSEYALFPAVHSAIILPRHHRQWCGDMGSYKNILSYQLQMYRLVAKPNTVELI